MAFEIIRPAHCLQCSSQGHWPEIIVGKVAHQRQAGDEATILGEMSLQRIGQFIAAHPVFQFGPPLRKSLLGIIREAKKWHAIRACSFLPNCADFTDIHVCQIGKAVLRSLPRIAVWITVHRFVGDIEALTEANADFRRVLYTGANLQLVLMAIQPGDEIGEEVHEDRDQFFRIETGEGQVWIDGVCNAVKADDGIIVPQGARHNVVNSGSVALKLYTIYGPPEHRDAIVHETKDDADNAHEHFDGHITESDDQHHPLPKDERARHDLVGETVEKSHGLGDDDPGAPQPSLTEPPHGHYRDPDGRPYDT